MYILIILETNEIKHSIFVSLATKVFVVVIVSSVTNRESPSTTIDINHAERSRLEADHPQPTVGDHRGEAILCAMQAQAVATQVDRLAEGGEDSAGRRGEGETTR